MRDLFGNFFDFSDAVVIFDDFRLYLLRLFRLLFAHELADLRAERVPLGAAGVPFLLQFAALCVQFEDFVYEGSFLS